MVPTKSAAGSIFLSDRVVIRVLEYHKILTINHSEPQTLLVVMSLSTSALYFPLVLAAACYYVYIRISLHRRKARFSKLHGCENLRRAPQNDPFLGLDHFFALGKAAAQRRYLEYFRNLFDEVGPTFGISLMGDDILFTNEPKNIQAVLAKNFADWEIGQRRKDCAAELLGVGVFTSDGETWEHGRAVVRPNFTRKQVSDLKVFEKHIQVLFESLPSDGSSVDLQEWVFRFVSSALSPCIKQLN